MEAGVKDAVVENTVRRHMEVITYNFLEFCP